MNQASLEVPLRGGLNLVGLGTLFRLTLRQHARGTRLLVLCVLFLLPVVIALLVRLTVSRVPSKHLEEVLIFYFMPHVLVPLAALLYASGMVQDEIEDQTLTYLLIRPLPRWAIYLTKLVATVLIASVLTGAFTLLNYAVLSWDQPEFREAAFPWRPFQVVGLFALNLLGYCSLFGLMSLFVKRSLVVGVIYIGLFEGLLANLEFAFRIFTVVYYFRLLSAHWLELNLREWRLRLDTAPSAVTALQVLVYTALLAAVGAALLFGRREFRVKTPEGS